jgi:hypothetical protein
MGHDVYRSSSTKGSNEARPEGRGEEFVIPALALVVGVILVLLGLHGGREHATEGGIGLVALIFATWSFVDARRATRS